MTDGRYMRAIPFWIERYPWHEKVPWFVVYWALVCVGALRSGLHRHYWDVVRLDIHAVLQFVQRGWDVVRCR